MGFSSLGNSSSPRPCELHREKRYPEPCWLLAYMFHNRAENAGPGRVSGCQGCTAYNLLGTPGTEVTWPRDLSHILQARHYVKAEPGPEGRDKPLGARLVVQGTLNSPEGTYASQAMKFPSTGDLQLMLHREWAA